MESLEKNETNSFSNCFNGIDEDVVVVVVAEVVLDAGRKR